MPSTYQPRPEAESLHIISLTYMTEDYQMIRTVGFLQKLSTTNNCITVFLETVLLLSSGISYYRASLEPTYR